MASLYDFPSLIYEIFIVLILCGSYLVIFCTLIFGRYSYEKSEFIQYSCHCMHICIMIFFENKLKGYEDDFKEI